ncbi:hypothetical protein VNO77_05468 [Canavalia gladiata]|uniref:beta-galactosidase n=1 Tax=Canavalia gladiata TaxID=3824 RepID=A0AAN9MYF0_CANGL
MLKKKKLFASQGASIILALIENEYGNIMSDYGDAGKAYINWCATMADSLHIGVPWVMCQQNDAPLPMLIVLHFDDRSILAMVGIVMTIHPTIQNSPKMWTENCTTGWLKNWGGKDSHRTPEDIAYAVARFDHGGTSFGNIAQPKWGHLKELHRVLKSMEESITNGNVSETDFGNSVKFPLGLSLLPDCRNEEYNTAKVNVQTSLMVKEKNKAEDEPIALKWVWIPENIDDALLGKVNVSADTLIDQKNAANDTSDYLWYITR